MSPLLNLVAESVLMTRPATAQQTSQETSYAPPSGLPPPPSSGIQSLAKPALPERKPSAAGTGPQADDLEDVKRVSSPHNSGFC